MFTRYASAVSTGTLVTFALLYAMQGLIHLQPGAQTDAGEKNVIDWIYLKPVTSPPPPPPQEFTKEALSRSVIPPAGAPSGEPGTGIHIAVRPAGPAPVATHLGRIPEPDGPLIAIVRVQPNYPGTAQAKGLEGWVDVRFDVLTNGQPANIVVSGSSSAIFERSAVNAAQKFRFRAPVVNGVPQVAHDVDYRFRFAMND